MRTVRRTRALIPLAVTLAVLGAACTDDDEPSEGSAAPEDTSATTDAAPGTTPELTGEGVLLGLIRPPTGLFDRLGQAQADAVALAAQDIADAGGVLGGPLTVVEDTPDTSRAVDVVFGDLVDAGARLIVGPTSSDEVRTLLPLIAPADAVVCGASTTAVGLTDPVAEGRFVRTVLDDSIVAVHTTQRLLERTAAITDREPRITVVARQDSYGISLSGTLAGLLDLAGNEVTVIGYAPEDVALAGVGDAVAASTPDQVVLVALEEGPRLADLVVRAGVAPTLILGLDGLAAPRFAEQADASSPTSLDGVTIIGSTGPLSFLTRLVEQRSGEVLYGAQAYDCAISYALAAEAAGSAEPAEVSAALREVTAGGNLCTSYADCVERLRAGEDIDYEGQSGPIDLGEDGEPDGGRFLTAVVTDGQLRVVSDLRIDLDQLRSQVAPRVAGFIASVQAGLAELGYYDGPIDGQQSDELTEAIRAFQTDQGLEPTGVLDGETLRALQTELAARGSLLTTSVLELQQLLTELGYYTGPIDGVWSDAVADAVRALQRDLGVPETGIIDAATLRAIYAAGLASGTPVEPPPTTTTAPPTTQAPTTTAAPAESSILDVLAATPEFSELAALLERADLAAVRAVLADPSTAATMFAPTNAALPDGVGELPAADLIPVLLYHVVGQPLTSADLAAAGESFAYDTLLEDPGNGFVTLLVEVDGAGTITIDGTATVVAPFDLAAGAGVVHAIDAVLAPPA